MIFFCVNLDITIVLITQPVDGQHCRCFIKTMNIKLLIWLLFLISLFKNRRIPCSYEPNESGQLSVCSVLLNVVHELADRFAAVTLFLIEVGWLAASVSLLAPLNLCWEGARAALCLQLLIRPTTALLFVSLPKTFYSRADCEDCFSPSDTLHWPGGIALLTLNLTFSCIKKFPCVSTATPLVIVT